MNEAELQQITKLVLTSLEKLEKQKTKKPSVADNEREQLQKFEKMGYKILKPFKKMLPVRYGRNKGELVEHFGYVMKRDRNVFAKVFSTKSRTKLENVWA
jgi:hypothetical protein